MLSFRGVTKSFGRVRALDRLSFAVEPGEVFGLLGPNGAGKTTSISLAVGLLRPEGGSIELTGIGEPHTTAAREALGVAPQSFAVYDDLTARENLELFAGLYGQNRRERRARASELLERVGLQDRARDRVAGFSGGMKRRLNLASALVHRPKIVLLDEPTAGVDPQSRNALFDIVRGLRDDTTTVVYTTHYMEEAQRLCDRVAIIDHGRLLALDSVDRLISQFGTDRARDAESPDLEPALQGTSGGDLESVFLELTGKTLRD